jgi:RNA polymerase sigma-70 factor (ECF subfamily)
MISRTRPSPPDETAVVEAVNRLPKKYRQVIYLYYIEGYATGEIAAILEMPQNTVLSQLARARKLLKTALKGEFDDV